MYGVLMFLLYSYLLLSIPTEYIYIIIHLYTYIHILYIYLYLGAFYYNLQLFNLIRPPKKRSLTFILFFNRSDCSTFNCVLQKKVFFESNFFLKESKTVCYSFVSRNQKVELL